MGMGDNIDVARSNQLCSALSVYGNGSKNKRKYLSEFQFDMIDVSALSLTEFPRYELLEEKLRNTQLEIESLEARSDNCFREQEANEFEQNEWDDPVVCQLQELLTHNLLETFRSAIKKVVESGYSKEIAEQIILRSGLYHGTKDVVSNAVDGGLAFLSREKEFENSRRHMFEDLDSLVSYTILEMIAVVREVKPCLTVAEAMWQLLICDLNLLHACLVERDHLGDFFIPEFSVESLLDPTISQSNSDASEASDANPDMPCTSKPPSVPKGQISQSGIAAKIVEATQVTASKNNVHDPLNVGKEVLSFPESRWTSLGTSKDHVPTVTQAVVEEKAPVCRKGSTGSSKRDSLRQRTFHFEKSYKGRMSKGAFKAKLTSLGNMVLDKTLKSPSCSSGVAMKGAYSKLTASVGGNPLPEGSFSVSSNSTQGPSLLTVNETVFALPALNSKSTQSSVSECKPDSKVQTKNTSSYEVPDYCAGIPYDQSLGKYVPQDDKDETILLLDSHMKALQKEIEVWKDWANEKVMQAARRLIKDQVELKMLRQEKEEADKFKKEMPSLEEGSMKRLSEMEHAISSASAQIETANLSIRRLEDENGVLKLEAEAAKVQALRATANWTSAVLREQEALKRSQLGDTEKISLQEELTTIKNQLADLQHQLEKSEARKNQMKGLWKQEEEAKLKHQKQAELLRKEIDQLEAQTKAEEDSIRETDDRHTQQCMESIKKLEQEISGLRLESESSRIAALLGGVDMSYGSGLMGNKIGSGFQVPKVNKRLAVFQDNFGAGSVKPERECAMCLTEEIAVLFLPCAHEVLCAECNALHEKQGMKDCPSCRTSIQKRIHVKYVSGKRV